MNSENIREYGHWSPALSAEKIFRSSEQISYMRPCDEQGEGGNGLFFLLNMPEENNALALMYQRFSGRPLRVSPPGYNLRSRVQEYGGLPWVYMDNAVYWCNFADQRIYRQPFHPATQEAGEPEALTPLCKEPEAGLRYADFIADPRNSRLICVREDHREKGQPTNSLVAIDAKTGGSGTVLFAGSDFVASPCLSPDGCSLVFQSWSHPDMPWDRTRLHMARITEENRLEALREIPQQKTGSVLQPRFCGDGHLYFIADWSNWWNLYRIANDHLASEQAVAETLLPMEAECCGPQWQLGNRNFDIIDGDRLLITVNRDCFWELAILDHRDSSLTTLQRGFGALEPVCWHRGKALFSAADTDNTPAIRRGFTDGDPSEAAETLFRCRSEAVLPPEQVSRARHFSYVSNDGARAHGLFYPPCNPACQAPADTLPPLLVCVHGGPTGTARTSYNPAIQFWTSRGFAVFDVNHRGSTGYGRLFRHSLYGQWGVVDIEDIITGIRHLIGQGRVDPNRIAIRGGSAGGYAVLSALVNSELFSAGTSYYGVSDLSMLAADTHKFESRYLDQLIGPWPEAESLYRERSPLSHIERIRAPVLLLQGEQDKVVPPNQAEAIFGQLQRNNPESRLIRFAEEAHGFRQPSNQIYALDSELQFYQSVLL